MKTTSVTFTILLILLTVNTLANAQQNQNANLVPTIEDFSIDPDYIGDEDAVADSCLPDLNPHRILRFTTILHNIGFADFVVGAPADNPDRFIFSSHGHFHLRNFNEYKLFNISGQQVISGFKQTFCLINREPISPHADATERGKFGCGGEHAIQGISAGWADVYSGGLDCQWLVIDEVPDGDYIMSLTTNAQRAIFEDSFDDNTVYVGLRIRGNTVTQIPVAQPEPPNFAQIDIELEVAFPNLSFTRPVDLQHPPDGTNRLFVVEQRGVISVFENNAGVTTKNVFLDIQNRVNDSGNEEGLLGLAFHPDYSSNGFFFANYTASNPRRTVIARYTASTTNPNVASENSELVLMEIDQPFSNHNGGGIVFGPDGYLYIGLGDGGSGGDPMGNGQDLSTLLGAMLRIDVNTTSDAKNYGIPPSNPFVGNPNGFREEIYAYGFRNPWRFSFDLETKWLWVGDVGQNDYEEIDIIQRGNNYGWNVMEGLHCFNPRVDCDTSGLALPIWEYNHSEGQSITGGFVYRGDNVPELKGAYIYADFVSGRLWALRYDGRNPAENQELLNTNLSIASFGIDGNNELYICAFDGKIYKFKTTVSTPSWDVNADGVVDIFDLVQVDSQFGQQVKNPEEDGDINLTGDINGDETVDILDLVLVGRHFGETTNTPAPIGALQFGR